MIPSIVAGCLVIVVAIVLLLRPRRPTPAALREQFRIQREHLEAVFLKAASETGKPRGLRWVECDWEPALEFARDLGNGMTTALAGVVVRFEAVPGSDMEGLAAVGNLRNGTALFVHDGVRWLATGRVLFNLNPDEVLRQFGKQFRPLS